MKLKTFLDKAGNWLPMDSVIIPKAELKTGFYYEGFLSRLDLDSLKETIARWDGQRFWYWIDDNTASISRATAHDQLGFSPVNEIEPGVSRYLAEIPMEKVKHE